jgi:hypothetical protein
MKKNINCILSTSCSRPGHINPTEKPRTLRVEASLHVFITINTSFLLGNRNPDETLLSLFAIPTELTRLFLIILTNHFLGLFPYIFTRTRHLTLTLNLTLPLWIRFVLFGWIKNTNHISEHLVPQGTELKWLNFIDTWEKIESTYWATQWRVAMKKRNKHLHAKRITSTIRINGPLGFRAAT